MRRVEGVYGDVDGTGKGYWDVLEGINVVG